MKHKNLINTILKNSPKITKRLVITGISIYAGIKAIQGYSTIVEFEKCPLYSEFHFSEEQRDNKDLRVDRELDNLGLINASKLKNDLQKRLKKPYYLQIERTIEEEKDKTNYWAFLTILPVYLATRKKLNRSN